MALSVCVAFSQQGRGQGVDIPAAGPRGSVGPDVPLSTAEKRQFARRIPFPDSNRWAKGAFSAGKPVPGGTTSFIQTMGHIGEECFALAFDLNGNESGSPPGGFPPGAAAAIVGGHKQGNLGLTRPGCLRLDSRGPGGFGHGGNCP